MRKRRLSTTISHEHWEILQKNLKKYGSQSKVLEAALERLDNDALFRLDEIQRKRVDLLNFPGAVLINRRCIKHTLEGRWERIVEEGLFEFGILVTSGKLTDRFTFHELVASFCYLLRLLNLFEEIAYEEAGDTCTVKLWHHEGKTYSKYFAYLHELFFRRQGIECKTEISEYFILHTLSFPSRERHGTARMSHKAEVG
jgi:hypothetical protein